MPAAATLVMHLGSCVASRRPEAGECWPGLGPLERRREAAHWGRGRGPARAPGRPPVAKSCCRVRPSRSRPSGLSRFSKRPQVSQAPGWVTSETLSEATCLIRTRCSSLFPGFGSSAPSKEASTEAGRAELLERVLRDLEVKNAVLVSPSLSGRYALPFLVRGHHQLRGFVPIAPAATESYTREQFRAVKTPTLILYGELDHNLARESLRQLRHLPNHTVVKLRAAGHACYLQKPQDFHLALLAFLDRLP